MSWTLLAAWLAATIVYGCFVIADDIVAYKCFEPYAIASVVLYAALILTGRHHEGQ